MIGGKPDFGVDEVLRPREAVPAQLARSASWDSSPTTDLPHFYGGAACFVYPSLFEGFGLPLVEAMACGTPGGRLESLGHAGGGRGCGALVDPENVDAIADAIARLLSDADLARDLARRGLERSRRYSWARRPAAPSPSIATPSPGASTAASTSPADLCEVGASV